MEDDQSTDSSGVVHDVKPFDTPQSVLRDALERETKARARARFGTIKWLVVMALLAAVIVTLIIVVPILIAKDGSDDEGNDTEPNAATSASPHK